jgi:hypothetical protein
VRDDAVSQDAGAEDAGVGEPVVEVAAPGDSVAEEAAPTGVVAEETAVLEPVTQGAVPGEALQVMPDAVAPVLSDAGGLEVPAVQKQPFYAQFGGKTVWIAAAAAAVVIIVAVAGFALYQRDQAQRAEKAKIAAQQLAAKKAEEKALVADFDAAMEVRVAILQAEAGVNGAVKAAHSSASGYNGLADARTKKVKSIKAAYDREVARVTAWNSNMSLPGILPYPANPHYPGKVAVPKFSSQTKSLKAADAALRAAAAKLTGLSVDPKFASLVTQLTDSCTALSDEALHDADVLLTCTKGGVLDNGAVQTLRTGSAKALLTAANTQAVAFIAQHRLDVRLYDVAGGRDMDPADSSILVSAQGAPQPTAAGVVTQP